MVKSSKQNKNSKEAKIHRIEPPVKNVKSFRFYEMVRNYEYKKIMVPTSDGSRLIPLQQVMYIQGEGNYVNIFLSNGEKILLSNTLKHWEAKLDSPFFARCHKSYLVNKNLINKVSYSKNQIYLQDAVLPISRYRKADFLKELSLLM